MPSLFEGLILASASPRRSELLAKIGIDFQVIPSTLAELPILDELPSAYTARMALEKALSVATSFSNHLVLGADTVVSMDNRILGKPQSHRDAEAMLLALSDRWHEVWTGVALVCGKRNTECVRVVRSEVHFRAMAPEEVAEYVATGEPMDKAGAYGIQGGARRFVKQVKGSYHNIVGLPTIEVTKMLNEVGYPLDDEQVPAPR